MPDKVTRNIRLTVEYDGTDYCGWQVQTRNRSKKSIQGVIERSLSRVLQENVRIIGSGRTDAGVHAAAQVANFQTSSGIPLKNLQLALNSLLPDDISIHKAEEASPGFHSRFDARSKIYRYTILNRPYPAALCRNTVYFYPDHLDVSLMKKEAVCLLGRHDFRSFRLTGEIEKDSVRTVKSINISSSKGLITIDIEANGFLHNMARSIAGTLIEIGRGKFPKGSLKQILLAKNRRLAGPTAPARGLTLLKVKY
jgi:tRNA pseudouridine38-40 synthase